MRAVLKRVYALLETCQRFRAAQRKVLYIRQACLFVAPVSLILCFDDLYMGLLLEHVF